MTTATAKPAKKFIMGKVQSAYNMKVYYGEPDEQGKRKFMSYYSKDAVNSKTKPDPARGLWKFKQDFEQKKLKDFSDYDLIYKIIIYKTLTKEQYSFWTPANGWQYASSNMKAEVKERYCLEVKYTDGKKQYLQYNPQEGENVMHVKNAFLAKIKEINIPIMGGSLYDNHIETQNKCIAKLTAFSRFINIKSI